MKVRKYQMDQERTILTALIVNDRVMSRLGPLLLKEKKLFQSKWSNIIAGWCADFFKGYGKAPRKVVESLFHEFAERSEDESSVSIIEKYLFSLNDEYETLGKELNEDHVIDLASNFFSGVRLDNLQKKLEAALARKDYTAAKEHYNEFKPVDLSSSAMINVLTDKERIQSAFEEEDTKSIIQYPGALGEFFGPHLERDGFIAFMAPEKRGKSSVLIDVAWRAVLDRRKTIFFSVGDMSEKQMYRRIGVRAVRRPRMAGEFRWPRSIKKLEDDCYKIDYGYSEAKGNLSSGHVIRAMKRVLLATATKRSLLKMRCTPNSTTSIQDIETEIEEQASNGFTCDVCIIDYMDILAPEPGSSKLDYRHQINENWKAARRISQKYHMLVVTATQSDAESYGAEIITRKNFSEDKRKLAHPTGVIGINQNPEEKKLGVMRLNWVLLREGEYHENKCVTVAGNLALVNPATCSSW